MALAENIKAVRDRIAAATAAATSAAAAEAARQTVAPLAGSVDSKTGPEPSRHAPPMNNACVMPSP